MFQIHKLARVSTSRLRTLRTQNSGNRGLAFWATALRDVAQTDERPNY